MTRQKAIDAKCQDCIYDEYADGTWRQQVEACELTACVLYPLDLSLAQKRPLRLIVRL